MSFGELASKIELVKGGQASQKRKLFQQGIHPGKLTWNLKITHLKRKIIFQTSIFRFHVSFPGCIRFGSCSWKEGRPLKLGFAEDILEKVKNILSNGAWRIIPVSKWLVTPIYKPFRPFIRGINLLRGLTNHGY